MASAGPEICKISGQARRFMSDLAVADFRRIPSLAEDYKAVLPPLSQVSISETYTNAPLRASSIKGRLIFEKGKCAGQDF